MVNNKTLLCIVDYYSKFPTVKVTNLSVDDLVQIAKMIFAEYELANKNCFSCRYKFQIRDIQGLLQKDVHPEAHNFILPPSEEWPSGSMHKIC